MNHTNRILPFINKPNNNTIQNKTMSYTDTLCLVLRHHPCFQSHHHQYLLVLFFLWGVRVEAAGLTPVVRDWEAVEKLGNFLPTCPPAHQPERRKLKQLNGVTRIKGKQGVCTEYKLRHRTPTRSRGKRGRLQRHW